MSKIAGVTDPERKRKIIGEEFVKTFAEVSKAQKGYDFLAQGTIYPDVIESGANNSANIKSHHNVGGLPKDLPFTGLVEPLRGLFKDEVRVIGKSSVFPTILSIVNPSPVRDLQSAQSAKSPKRNLTSCATQTLSCVKKSAQAE